MEPSRFLDDIPPHLLDGRARGRRGPRRVAADPDPAPSSPTPSAAAAPPARFQPGARVRHPLWGEGLVLQTRLEDGEEIVDVLFESVGFKRLIASVAGLVPIS